MKLKTKLLPVFGGLTATVAVVTPLATSCSEWVRYTDMLHEYTTGVVPYEETQFSDYKDIDELYWERFSKNNDILRDDMLWTISKVVRYDIQHEITLKSIFKKVNKYNFDITINEVIQDDEETRRVDESGVKFTITWDFGAEFNTSKRPHIGDIWIDVIDSHMTFETIDPWILWFQGTTADSHLKNYWEMELTQPVEPDDGLVCIRSNTEYRYSELEERTGDKWDEISEHVETRDLWSEAEVTDSAMQYMMNFLIDLLADHVHFMTSETGFAFASPYLRNVSKRQYA